MSISHSWFQGEPKSLLTDRLVQVRVGSRTRHELHLARGSSPRHINFVVIFTSRVQSEVSREVILLYCWTLYSKASFDVIGARRGYWNWNKVSNAWFARVIYNHLAGDGWLTFVFSDYVLESLSDPEAGRSASKSTRQFHIEVSWRIRLKLLKSLVFAKAISRLGCTEVYDIVANSVAPFSHINCK